jgi:ABC-type nitrate/sulfonate/bicarbonate transport system substrate-binding protein
MVRVLVSALCISFLCVSVHAADKIRIGFPDLAAQFIPLPLGEARGFFKEEGIQAEFVRIVPTVALAAMASGEIDYYTSIGSGIAGMLRGLPIKVVSCYVPSAPIALISRPEVKSVSDLRGKTIGINTYGSPIEVIGKLIVKHFGLDPEKDVKFLATGVVESRFAAMKQGLTVATLGSAPIDFQGKKMGFVVLASAHELFSYPASGLVATINKIRERPDEVKKTIKAGIKANRYIAQNREGTVQEIMNWLKINPEMASATYGSVAKAFNSDGGVPEDGLRLVIEEAKKVTKVNREASINEAMDLSLLKQAQRELSIGPR